MMRFMDKSSLALDTYLENTSVIYKFGEIFSTLKGETQERLLLELSDKQRDDVNEFLKVATKRSAAKRIRQEQLQAQQEAKTNAAKGNGIIVDTELIPDNAPPPPPRGARPS
jgi:hypothetical protein